ncbi:MAG: hypothetical protein ACE5KA_06965 [Nitrososphaerales archaeon]
MMRKSGINKSKATGLVMTILLAFGFLVAMPIANGSVKAPDPISPPVGEPGPISPPEEAPAPTTLPLTKPRFTTDESGTPYQRAVKEAIDKLISEGKPHPKATFEPPIVKKEANKVTIETTTVLEFEHPREAGKDRWDDFTFKKMPYTGPGTIVKNFVDERNFNQLIIDKYPQLYGEGAYTFGEEPRKYTINESFVIAYPEGSLKTLDTIPVSPHHSPTVKDILMGFTWAPTHIDWTIGFKISVKDLGLDIDFEIASAKFGFILDIAAGLRLPAEVQMNTPDFMQWRSVETPETFLTPLDFNETNYKELFRAEGHNDPDLLDRLAQDGDEFVFKFEAFLGFKVTVIELWDVIDLALIDIDLDLAEMCTQALKDQAMESWAELLVGTTMNPLEEQLEDLLEQHLRGEVEQSKEKLIVKLVEWLFTWLVVGTMAEALEAEVQAFQQGLDELLKEELGEELGARVMDQLGEEMKEQLMLQLGLEADCENFVTPFGSDENGRHRFLPIPGITFEPDETGLEFGWKGASFGLGLKIDPEIGSDTITANQSVLGDAEPVRDAIEYTDTSPVTDARSDSVALRDIEATIDGDLATVTLDDFRFIFDSLIVRLGGNVQFGGVLDLPATPYVTILEYNLADDLPLEIYLEQHEGTTGLRADIQTCQQLVEVESGKDCASLKFDESQLLTGSIGESIQVKGQLDPPPPAELSQEVTLLYSCGCIILYVDEGGREAGSEMLSLNPPGRSVPIDSETGIFIDTFIPDLFGGFYTVTASWERLSAETGFSVEPSKQLRPSTAVEDLIVADQVYDDLLAQLSGDSIAPPEGWIDPLIQLRAIPVEVIGSGEMGPLQYFPENKEIILGNDKTAGPIEIAIPQDLLGGELKVLADKVPLDVDISKTELGQILLFNRPSGTNEVNIRGTTTGVEDLQIIKPALEPTKMSLDIAVESPTISSLEVVSPELGEIAMNLGNDGTAGPLELAIPKEMKIRDLIGRASFPTELESPIETQEPAKTGDLTGGFLPETSLSTQVLPVAVSETKTDLVVQLDMPADSTIISIEAKTDLAVATVPSIMTELSPELSTELSTKLEPPLLPFVKPTPVPGIITMSEAGTQIFHVEIAVRPVAEAIGPIKSGPLPGHITMSEAGTTVFLVNILYKAPEPVQDFPFAMLGVAAAIGVGLFFGVSALLRREER